MALKVYVFAQTGSSMVDLAVGPDGALYALASAGSGSFVYRYQVQ